MQDNVRTIGRCPGCEKQAALQDGSCKLCLARFGPKFSVYASRVRSDEGFKKKCYGLLTTDYARQQFVIMFGPPANSLDSMAEGSS